VGPQQLPPGGSRPTHGACRGSHWGVNRGPVSLRVRSPVNTFQGFAPRGIAAGASRRSAKLGKTEECPRARTRGRPLEFRKNPLPSTHVRESVPSGLKAKSVLLLQLRIRAHACARRYPFSDLSLVGACRTCALGGDPT